MRNFTERTQNEAAQRPFFFTICDDERDREQARARYSTELDRVFFDRLRATSLQQENIVFIFDEARVLWKSHQGKDFNFIELRRALTHFPRDKETRCPLSLMTDTVATVSNFAPVRKMDQSGRATAMPQGIFPPFFLLANVDIWVDNDGPKTLANMVDPQYYCRYGRPHWGALARHFADGALQISHIMELARFKVLGGNDGFESIQPHEFPVTALAILGIRVCIDMVPQCQLSQDLVAQHMRALYHVSASRDAVFTGYFSEPVLVQAAGQLSNMDALDGSARWVLLLRVLVQSLKNVQVNAGFRGELVARILLMLAWDKCCSSDVAHDKYSSGFYLRPAPLTKFLESLLCLGEDTKRSLDTAFNKDQCRAWVRCTHFVKIDYVPGSAQLLELFRRGAAVAVKELQAGTDLIIPIAFCKDESVEVTEEMVSCVFIQVKNRKGRDPGYPETATTFQTPAATGVTISEKNDFLSVYMSLGPYCPARDCVITLPGIRRYPTRGVAGVEKGSQQCLAVFALSERAYRPLVGNDELERLLHLVNQSWVDPVILQETEEDGRLIASMLPFQCCLTVPAASSRTSKPGAAGNGAGAAIGGTPAIGGGIGAASDSSSVAEACQSVHDPAESKNQLGKRKPAGESATAGKRVVPNIENQGEGFSESSDSTRTRRTSAVKKK
jgi:hypothetical protein